MKKDYNSYYGPPLLPKLPEEEAEEYEDIGVQTCDECGVEVELLYGGMVICEVCGKHFPDRG